MSGVIALDPDRLRGLETVLLATSERWNRLGGRLTDEVAATGLPVSSEHITGVLRQIAAGLVTEHDDVVWRRAAVEAMDGELPMPDLLYLYPADRAALARQMAEGLEAAIDQGWGAFTAAVDEIMRGAEDPLLMAAVFEQLDPEVAAALWTTAEELFLADWKTRGGSSADHPAKPPESESQEVFAVYEALSEALRQASVVKGDAALSDEWLRSFAGTDNEKLEDVDEDPKLVSEVTSALQKAGWGLSFAKIVAQVAGRGGLAVALGKGAGVVGFIRVPLILLEGDGSDCDAPEAMFAGLGTATALVALWVGSNPAGWAITGGALLLAAASALMSGDCDARRDPRFERTFNPGTGETTYSGGSANSPYVDQAGVPLP